MTPGGFGPDQAESQFIILVRIFFFQIFKPNRENWENSMEKGATHLINDTEVVEFLLCSLACWRKYNEKAKPTESKCTAHNRQIHLFWPWSEVCVKMFASRNHRLVSLCHGIFFHAHCLIALIEKFLPKISCLWPEVFTQNSLWAQFPFLFFFFFNSVD